MRSIRITAKWINDPGYGMSYDLFLDSDTESIENSSDLFYITELGKDYLQSPEYKDEFVARIKYNHPKCIMLGCNKDIDTANFNRYCEDHK